MGKNMNNETTTGFSLPNCQGPSAIITVVQVVNCTYVIRRYWKRAD